MAKKKGGFADLLFTTIMPKVYGIGAAVVIVGALFKIQHWDGASEMLIVGLGTEAVIFFLSAFEPKHPEADWSKVYPELAEDYEGTVNQPSRISNRPAAGDSPLLKIDEMLKTAKVDQNLLDNLGKGLTNLATSASQMSNLSNAAVATNDYAKNVQAASASLTEMNKSYGTAMKAVGAMADASKDTSEYHKQVQSVTKNLAALNTIYEMELKDADSHVKNMNKFYESLTGAMQGLSKVGDNTAKFTSELGNLTTNLTALNKVYGSMLTAMKG
ncbi:MAG: gliding motility protein GldL [Cytophagales bacterium]|jgi:gliding motility-associated protein GldL|nr:gliding motility protein GldL [Cytophagales bacterium]MCA6368976.1 gliding motility protein GldL [Cytophagales bacterium]MCA6371514.1 gliding motility protein GldL [Cytophagales bacterium]MCA6377799.1 gliding motility protein GldL [Cytophagales bacterium]MCA6385239.1 gliding motility protein GldL [Cytophagales bacterium]